ncbi:hypothetical protein CEXT_148441 [Caerostris extrusa]|uniref:Uncharacterized protein n=1 Tax=Caerostris extrusa TaxID=172846 RepID=A0AAV4XQ28_CAEEX|nr:hypothetical protein CEXT_148441 [Caerostris extrusa]
MPGELSLQLWCDPQPSVFFCSGGGKKKGVLDEISAFCFHHFLPFGYLRKLFRRMVFAFEVRLSSVRMAV